MSMPATRGLSTTERVSLYLFAGLVVAFGILVELRSAGLSRRMGDLGCYLRAAWAAEVGQDVYAISDDNDWHYNYPPFYALLLMPLADPPTGSMTGRHVPYPISVALFYALNMVLLFWSAHALAAALEDTTEDEALAHQPRFCRRWWALRLWPVLFFLPPAAQTAMRGQVNHIVLALVCLCAARLLRGQRWRAGLALGFAICIKVIPVYLLVYPLWKRDLRTVLGCGLGLVLGLVVVPLAILGPERTAHQYQRYGEVFFAPLFGVNEDKSRHDELLGVNATDSVGLRNALNNWTHRVRDLRPSTFSPTISWTYRVLGGLMTLLVLWPGTLGRPRGPWFEATQFGALVLLMAILSPICHLHYLIFCLPLAITVVAQQWEFRESLRLHPVLVLALAAFTLTNVVPSFPGLERFKDLCVNMFGTLPLFFAGLVQLWRRPRALETIVPIPTRQAA